MQGVVRFRIKEADTERMMDLQEVLEDRGCVGEVDSEFGPVVRKTNYIEPPYVTTLYDSSGNPHEFLDDEVACIDEDGNIWKRGEEHD